MLVNLLVKVFVEKTVNIINLFQVRLALEVDVDKFILTFLNVMVELPLKIFELALFHETFPIFVWKSFHQLTFGQLFLKCLH